MVIVYVYYYNEYTLPWDRQQHVKFDSKKILVSFPDPVWRNPICQHGS